MEQDIRDVEILIREAESEARKAADAGDLTERDFWRVKERQLRAEKQQLRAEKQFIREEKARSEALQPGMGP